MRTHDNAQIETETGRGTKTEHRDRDRGTEAERERESHTEKPDCLSPPTTPVPLCLHAVMRSEGGRWSGSTGQTRKREVGEGGLKSGGDKGVVHEVRESGGGVGREGRELRRS